MIDLLIYGEPASKANQRRLIFARGKPMFIKSAKAMNYGKSFKKQCEAYTGGLLSGDLGVEMHIYYSSRRPDLDASLILDLLQDVVYKNDRQVKEQHLYWHLDKNKPRTEIRVWPLDTK